MSIDVENVERLTVAIVKTILKNEEEEVIDSSKFLRSFDENGKPTDDTI